MAYERTGCGPAVLILHGFSADRRMWRDLVPAWRAHATLVLVDLPSHGASALARADADPVDDLLEMLGDERLERVAIVGHSAGAALAVDFAARVPARTSALVLLSPSLNGFSSRRPLDLSAVAARARAGDPAGAAEAWLATPIMRTALTGDRAAWFRTLVRDNTRVWQLQAPRAPPPRPPVHERLAALRLPLFIGEGMLDRSGTRDVANAILQAQPTATHQRFAHAGHWFPVERPDVVRARVLTFLLHAWCRDVVLPRRAPCQPEPSTDDSGRLADVLHAH